MQEDFNTSGYPLAYLFTFRSYGTWLPGDKRGTITKYVNKLGELYLPENKDWEAESRSLLLSKPFEIDSKRRGVIQGSIRESCRTFGPAE